jgi:2,4-dienoyl-CoA reductase-like NADH-dependent reductase (Old Yellow Enzyme family)
MNVLFEPTQVGHMVLRNRFVRSATVDGCADNNGYVTDKQVKLFAELAEGGVGLIITGAAYIHPSGGWSIQNSIASDDIIPGFTRLTEATHKRGAKIAVQLHHLGSEHAVMTEDDIWDMVWAFGDAAQRAKEARFDAVQIHAAHGYLLSKFLSPHTNCREDGWGGSLEQRLRFHRETYQAIRSNVGDDYPVLVKLGVQDGIPGGLAFSDGLIAARFLSEQGIDALEISIGLFGQGYDHTALKTKINRLDREADFRDWCREVKNAVNVPVMMVGGLRTPELMAEIVELSEADFVSLSRPLVREPGIINEWKQGNHRRAKCISCNLCLEALWNDETLRCFAPKAEVES